MEVLFFLLMMVIAIAVGFPVLGLFKLFLTIVFWMVIGNVAGLIIRGDDYGVLGNITLGLVGGVVGTFALGLIGFGGFAGSLIGSFITGVIGAIIVIYIMSLFDGNKSKR